jgi:hypothetical protein
VPMEICKWVTATRDIDNDMLLKQISARVEEALLDRERAAAAGLVIDDILVEVHLR